jgi:hypothetical protein
MVRGLIGARLGVCLVVVIAAAAAGAAGCQPLYGGKPERLPAPSRKKPPKEEATVEAPVKTIDECQADFRSDPRAVRQQASLASQLTGEGDTAFASSAKAADPTAQASLLRESVDKYRSALIKDPYSIEATLKLALAYDKALRKGCAIAMLKRLAALAANPRFARTANPAIDSISDNAQWFKYYRKDAMAAVGR